MKLQDIKVQDMKLAQKRQSFEAELDPKPNFVYIYSWLIKIYAWLLFFLSRKTADKVFFG